jgi:hypothetical protein
LNAEKAQKMKTGGAVLVVLGSILVISGGVTIANNFDLWSDENDDKAKTGAILFAFGAASLGAGIPLTIVGSHKQRKYRNQLDAISVRANFSPQHRGVGLTYRF